MTTTINASTSSGLVNTADTSGILQLQTASTAAVTIDASQNVGIGTSSPTGRLHVSAPASTQYGTFDAVTATSAFTNYKVGGTVYGYLGDASGLVTGGTAGDLALRFSGAMVFSGGANERMRIDTSGNVGIGTTPPAWSGFKALDIGSVSSLWSPSSGNGTSYYSNNLYYNGSARIYKTTGNASEYTQGGGSHQWYYAASGTAGNSVSLSEAMRIANDGSLLVGTTANIGANAKIYAVGSGKGIAVGTGPGSNTFRHLYMNTSDTNLYFFNDANYAYLNGSGAWTNASDARLKKNIVDIKYGLADVLKAQPRSYQMHDVAGDFVGFVAQELQTVIPEVVSGDPEKQLGVDYGSLVAVAFKAIQELKAINDTQAETINALTARIVALEGK